MVVMMSFPSSQAAVSMIRVTEPDELMVVTLDSAPSNGNVE